MGIFHHDPDVIVILDDDREEIKLLKHIINELREIRRELKPHRYTIKIKEFQMAISVGATGTFAAQLEDNGNPIPLPAGSTFAWSTDDTNATVAPSADTLSAVVSVPATDTATSITVTAETVAPDGNKVQGSVTVPIIPGVAHTFTVKVTQTA